MLARWKKPPRKRARQIGNKDDSVEGTEDQMERTSGGMAMAMMMMMMVMVMVVPRQQRWREWRPSTPERIQRQSHHAPDTMCMCMCMCMRCSPAARVQSVSLFRSTSQASGSPGVKPPRVKLQAPLMASPSPCPIGDRINWAYRVALVLGCPAAGSGVLGTAPLSADRSAVPLCSTRCLHVVRLLARGQS